LRRASFTYGNGSIPFLLLLPWIDSTFNSRRHLRSTSFTFGNGSIPFYFFSINSGSIPLEYECGSVPQVFKSFRTAYTITLVCFLLFLVVREISGPHGKYYPSILKRSYEGHEQVNIAFMAHTQGAILARLKTKAVALLSR